MKSRPKPQCGMYKAHCSSDDPALLSDIVLVECAWVLGDLYEYSRSQIGDAIDGLLATAQLRAANPAGVGLALQRFRASAGRFRRLSDWSEQCKLGLRTHTAHVSTEKRRNFRNSDLLLELSCQAGLTIDANGPIQDPVRPPTRYTSYPEAIGLGAPDLHRPLSGRIDVAAATCAGMSDPFRRKAELSAGGFADGGSVRAEAQRRITPYALPPSQHFLIG